MSTRKAVLVLGMKPIQNDPNSSFTPESVKKALDGEIQKANEAGFDFIPYPVDTQSDQTVEEIRKVLKSRQWDGVSIGFGIRSNPALTPLFEKLVNACIEDIHPTPKLAFAVTPTTAFEAIERVFAN